MYLIPIAWIYVALMMAVAEATNTNGTVLGAIVTFVFYGLLPMALVSYLMGAPMRKRSIKAREAAELEAARRQPAPDTVPLKSETSIPPDASGHATGHAITAVRKEP